MRVLLDECLPHALRKHFPNHEVLTAFYAGLAGYKNGALLQAAVDAGFELLVTGDKTLHKEKIFRDGISRSFPSPYNSWRMVKLHVNKIAAAVDGAKAGRVTTVDCGTSERFWKSPDSNC